ncbi:hypothetical protein BY996DRAFT_6615108 [Phakopsora pachyrhizi]|nr:hypothetical protein BY996DRAFT_6615108 [Phakopsora pachyrhizi]
MRLGLSNSSYYREIDQEDDRIEEHFLRSNCSLSSKKSKSEPIRLTRLFGLLMEDEEEEQQPEGFLIGFPFLVNGLHKASGSWRRSHTGSSTYLEFYSVKGHPLRFRINAR